MNIENIKQKILSTENILSLDKHIKQFLKDNYIGDTLSQRVYHFKNGFEIPKCPNCGKNCNWTNTKKEYSKFCSRSCYNSSNITKQKKKEYFMSKYGVDNPAKSKEVQEKIKQTNLEKYGYTHHMKTDESKKNKKEYFMSKYGVDNPAKSKEVQEKIKQTNLEKYGYTHHMKTDEIKDKVHNTNYRKYGVKTPIQRKEVQEKIKQTNLEKYGYTHHVYQNMTEKTYEILNSKQDMIDELVRYGGNLVQLASEHNLNVSTIHKKTISMDIRQPYKTGIISFLENMYSNYNIKLNCRSRIKPLELDLVFVDHNLALEINGIYWHSIQKGKDKEYHINKINRCNEQGIKLLMIWDFDWENHNKRTKYIDLINLLLNNNLSIQYIKENYGNIVPMDLFGWISPYRYIMEPELLRYKEFSYWNSGYKVIL